MNKKKITQVGVRIETKEALKSLFDEVFSGAHIQEKNMIATLLEFTKKFIKNENEAETLFSELRKIHSEITSNQK